MAVWAACDAPWYLVVPSVASMLGHAPAGAQGRVELPTFARRRLLYRLSDRRRGARVDHRHRGRISSPVATAATQGVAAISTSSGSAEPGRTEPPVVVIETWTWPISMTQATSVGAVDDERDRGEGLVRPVCERCVDRESLPRRSSKIGEVVGCGEEAVARRHVVLGHPEVHHPLPGSPGAEPEVVGDVHVPVHVDVVLRHFLGEVRRQRRDHVEVGEGMPPPG